MKQTLLAGIAVTKRILVDEGRCISFMGQENMVYATPPGMEVTIAARGSPRNAQAGLG
jgi:hypothetical protein